MKVDMYYCMAKNSVVAGFAGMGVIRIQYYKLGRSEFENLCMVSEMHDIMVSLTKKPNFK